MKVCPKCKKEQEEGAKFCGDCGAQIFENVFCPNCGAKTSAEFSFCEQCGSYIKEYVINGDSTDTVGLRKDRHKISKKMFIGIGLTTVVAILIFFFTWFSGNGKGQNYCMYIQGGEIVFNNFKRNGAYELTSRLSDDADYMINSNGKFDYSDYVKLSKDEKYVFYPDRLDDDEGVVLFRRNLNKPKEEPLKIDSEIMDYRINDDGTKIIYLRGSGNGLYVSDMNQKEKIASEVDSFYVTNDCKKVGYFKSDNGGYYIQYEGKEKKKIANDVEFVNYVSEDLSTVYYTKENSLYKQIEGEDDAEKIAADVCEVEKIYDSGEIYYMKDNDEPLEMIDFVIDDMKDADAAMEEPEEPNYPWRYEYNTNAAYEAALDLYEKESEKYEQADMDYSAKLDRDSIRETLEEDTVENASYTLYYYDGKESKALSDSVVGYDFSCAEQTAGISYSEYRPEEDSKVKISDIESIYDVEESIYEAMENQSKKYIAIGDEISELDQTKAQQIVFSENGKRVFFLDDVSEKERGSLYQAAIEEGKVQNPKLVDDDVSSVYVTSINNNITYFKNFDVDRQRGDLCVDGKEIDFDVSTEIQQPDGKIIYFTDWNDNKHYGTLKIYDNGEKTQIADDVFSYSYTPERLLYLYDYSWNTNCGTLYMYKKDKTEKIADDVACIIK